MSEALSTPWPPRPATTTLVTLLIGCPVLQPSVRRAGRAALLHHLLRRGLLVEADLRRGEHAGLAHDDQRRLGLRQQLLQQRLERGVGVHVLDKVDVLNAHRAPQCLEADLARRVVVQRAACPRVLLLAGHRRRAVVEDQHHVPGLRRVVDHLGDAGDAGVHEGRVADHADDPFRLVIRQHVPQAEPDADARAHADAGVHRLQGRQHAERVAADVARDDAVHVLEDLEHVAVRAALTELRRLAPGRDRLGAGVAVEDAAHARHVELAEAVHLRLAFGRYAGGAQRVLEHRVALLDHDQRGRRCRRSRGWRSSAGGR